MLRFLFLVPVVMLVVWSIYLLANGYSLDDGKKGYIKILYISIGIAVVYLLLMWIT
ncbi:MAG: hypothetical protein Alis3KO_10390 [Aliiglaciecola sp.]